MFTYKSKIQHVYINYILKNFLKSYKKYYMLVNLYLQKKTKQKKYIYVYIYKLYKNASL